MRYFIHFPKTGGSSFRRLILENYKYNEVLMLKSIFSGGSNFPDKTLELLNKKDNKIKIIIGHFNCGIHNYIKVKKDQNSSDIKYLCIFREIFSRSLSLFYYALQKKNHYLRKELKNNNDSFVKLIKETENWEFINPYCRTFCDIKNQKDNDMTMEHYEQAVRNIDNLLLVGLYEKFELTTRLFLNYLNINFTYLPQENVNKKQGYKKIQNDKDLSEIKEIFYKRNTLDLKLYEHVKNRFNLNVKDYKQLENNNLNKDKSTLYKYKYYCKFMLTKFNSNKYF